MNPATTVYKPFRYYGGTACLARRFAALLPPHRVCIEPFLGSGAVICARAPAPHELVNDLDGHLVTFYRVLRDRPDELARACALSPYARDEYQHCRTHPDGDDVDDVEVARRFFVTVTQAFSATTAGTTGWSVSLGRNVSPARSMRNTIDRFDAIAQRFAAVQIENHPAWDVIDSHANHPDTVIYCDPPYVHATRTNGAANARSYRHEMTDIDHERLAVSLHTTTATVLLSGYPGDLYHTLYTGWDRIEIPTSTNATLGERQERTEVIWSNRPLANQLRLALDLNPSSTPAKGVTHETEP